MNPINQMQKTIGVVLAILTVIGVVGVTAVQERAHSAAVAAAQQAASSSTAAASPAPVKTVPKAPVTTPVVTTRSRSGDGDGNDDGGTGSAAPAPTAVVTPPPATVPKQTASVYKNGTYTATGSYGSPGGQEQIAVTLTLANDIITSSSVTPEAGDRTSLRYQNAFISGYQQYVVGQNIASVNLTYVSGSSLTPIGFDNALASIKSQAKA